MVPPTARIRERAARSPGCLFGRPPLLDERAPSAFQLVVHLFVHHQDRCSRELSLKLESIEQLCEMAQNALMLARKEAADDFEGWPGP